MYVEVFSSLVSYIQTRIKRPIYAVYYYISPTSGSNIYLTFDPDEYDHFEDGLECSLLEACEDLCAYKKPIEVLRNFLEKEGYNLLDYVGEWINQEHENLALYSFELRNLTAEAWRYLGDKQWKAHQANLLIRAAIESLKK